MLTLPHYLVAAMPRMGPGNVCPMSPSRLPRICAGELVRIKDGGAYVLNTSLLN